MRELSNFTLKFIYSGQQLIEVTGSRISLGRELYLESMPNPR